MTTPSVIADLKLQLASAEHDLAFVHYRACLATYIKEAEKGVSIEEFRALEALSTARHALSVHAIALERHVNEARSRPAAVVQVEAVPPPPKVVTKPTKSAFTKPVTKAKGKT